MTRYLFFLKKLFTSFILPPGFLIFIFLLIAFVTKKKLIRFLAICSALCVYLISIEPCKDLLLSPLESGFSIPGQLNANAIVILGGGNYSWHSLKEDTANRLYTGFMVYKKTNLPIIVSGGAVEGKIPDSKIMAEFLKEMGVESDKIIQESESRDTAQNALYVTKICNERGFKKIILVTSAYHMKRAVRLFKSHDIDVLPYPSDFKHSKKYNVYSFLPNFGNFAVSSKAIREHIALIFY